jgi:hypothetical protein
MRGSGLQQTLTSFSGLLSLDLTRGGSLSFTLSTGHTDNKAGRCLPAGQHHWRKWTFMLGCAARPTTDLPAVPQATAATRRQLPGVTPTNTGSARRYARPDADTFYNRTLSSPAQPRSILGAAGDCQDSTCYARSFNAGFEQGIGKFLVVDGELLLEIHGCDYDFDTIFNTDNISDSVEEDSKIDASVSSQHACVQRAEAYAVLGHSRSRFFAPRKSEVSSSIMKMSSTPLYSAIDHDQAFQQTTHLQYQPKHQRSVVRVQLEV